MFLIQATSLYLYGNIRQSRHDRSLRIVEKHRIYLDVSKCFFLCLLLPDPKVLFFVIFSGALGALFSPLIRLYDFKELPQALMRPEIRLRNWQLLIYSLVPPVIGAIAATALYVAFASGLITGTLFPAFKCHPEGAACNTFALFVQNYGPETVDNFAKALIWGFLSGFSERLVPDLLQQVTDTRKL